MNLTPIEQKIIERLSDGRLHPRSELLDLIDELCSPGAFRAHMHRIRKKLPEDQDIWCIFHKQKPHYRYVKLLNGSS